MLVDTVEQLVAVLSSIGSETPTLSSSARLLETTPCPVPAEEFFCMTAEEAIKSGRLWRRER